MELVQRRNHTPVRERLEYVGVYYSLILWVDAGDTPRQGLLLYEIRRALNKPQRPHVGEPIPASVLKDWEGNPRGFLAWLRDLTLSLGR